MTPKNIDLGDLDALLDEAAIHSKSKTAPPVSRQKISDVFSLTPMQRRMFSHYHLTREAAQDSYNRQEGAYNIFGAFRLTGVLDLNLLDEAIKKISNRHQILQAIFIEDEDGNPVQQLCKQSCNHLSIVHVGSDELPTLIDRERCRQFDLCERPPWHITIACVDRETSILLVCFHHILIDGQAVAVIMSDLASAYNGIPLPPVTKGFFDYLSEHKVSGDKEKVLERAVARLQGASCLELPRDNFSVVPFDGFEVEFSIGRERSKRIDQACLYYECSPFAFFGAVFCIVLNAYSSQEDFILGASIVDRSEPSLKDMVGLLVEMAAIRCEVSDGETLADVLRRFLPAYLAAMDDIAASPRDIARRLRIKRDRDYGELLSAVITYFPRDAESLPILQGLGIEKIGAQTTSRFDLELFLSPGRDGYEGNFVPNAKRLGKTTIQSMSAYFISVIDAIIEDGTQRVGDVGQQPEIASSASYLNGAFSSIHEQILEVCRTNKDAVAVSVPIFSAHGAPPSTSVLSYRELDAWSSRIAAALIDFGVKPGDLVGLFCDRNEAIPAAILGVLRMGAAYVPIDPNYPQQHAEYILSDAQVAVCLVSKETVKFPLSCGAIDVLQLRSGNYQHRPGPDITENALAYVIYTSGSTGRPKGVKVTHKNVLRLFGSTESWFNFCNADVWAMTHSYAFDFSVWEIFGALLYGGRLTIVSDNLRRDPECLSEIVISEGVTFLSQTPTAFSMIIERLRDRLASLHPSEQKLRHIVFGGEALSLNLFENWFSKISDTYPKLTNMYGITETTVHVTYRQITRDDLKQGSRSPIGIPISDLKLSLINKLGREVPKGAPGEILVIGDGVSSGYLNQPELTEQRFIVDPNGERLLAYRSGDFGRYDQDGELIFIGREDKQVKIRGYRIELGEVQHALEQVSGVKAAIVVPKKGADGNDSLVAYFIPESQENNKNETVIGWQRTFDQHYKGMVFCPNRPDFTGWISSYNGEKIPQAEMEAWLEETLSRILSVGAKNILEIGCGSGMLMSGCAPLVEHYCGIDVSGAAIDALAKGVADIGWDNVRLYEISADEIDKNSDKLLENGHFDLIIINSVIQYFPSSAYLHKVLNKAALLIAPGGYLFLGDIRPASGRVASAFSHRILDPSKQKLGVDFSWKDCVDDASKEIELMFDPGWVLTSLASRRPRLWPRMKYFQPLNELSKFRYDLIVQLDQINRFTNLDEIIVDKTLDLGALAEILRDTPETAFFIRGIKNARLDEEILYTGILLDAAEMGVSADPAELEKLGRECNRKVATFWSADRNINPEDFGCFDVFISSAGEGADGFLPNECVLSNQVFEPFIDETLNKDECIHQLPDRGLEILVRASLAKTLPAHMIPESIVSIDQFPLTPVGKLDLDALPEPGFHIKGNTLKSQVGAKKSSTIQDELANIVSALTKRSKVEPEENFFEIGGHSLLAVRLANSIQDKFGIEGCLPIIFSALTLREIFEFVEQSVQDGMSKLDSIKTINSSENLIARPNVLPATRAQARFFISHQLNPNSAYNVSAALKITGPVNLECLKEAFRSVIERHEGLRTVFDLREGHVVQIINDDVKPFLKFETVAGDSRSETDVKRALVKEASYIFDLTTNESVRVKIFPVAFDEIIIGINIHHIRIDGDSLGVLTKDLCHFYNSAITNTSARLDVVLQPSDIAAWEGKQSPAKAEKLEKFWLKHLDEAPQVVVFPKKLGKQGAASFELNVSEELWAAVKQIAAPLNIGPFPVLFGAYALAIGKFTARANVVVGNVISQRTRDKWKDIVAPLINTLPTRIQLIGHKSSAEFLKYVRNILLETREHGDLPLDEIVEKISKVGKVASADIFQSLIAWQAFEQVEINFDGLFVEKFLISETEVKSDFSLLLTEVLENEKSQLRARFTVDSQKLSPSVAISLAEYFERFLTLLVNPKITWPEIFIDEPMNEDEVQTSLTGYSHSLNARDIENEELLSFSSVPNYIALNNFREETDLAEKVRLGWARILGVPDLLVDDDIFNRGAHSLTVLRLAQEITKIIGRHVPAAIIFNSRTLQGTLQQSLLHSSPDRILSPLTTLTGAPAIFLFPDVSGKLLSQQYLIEELSAKFDVWGVQFSLDQNLPGEFPALITRIADALVDVKLDEPFHMLGYSFGVQLMGHTAACLEARGVNIGGVVALDALPQSAGKPMPMLEDETLRWSVLAKIVAQAQFNVELEINEQELRSKKHSERVSEIAHILSSASGQKDTFDTEIISDLWHTFSYLSQAILPSMPPISRRVALIASQNGEIAEGDLVDWCAISPESSFHICGGDHTSMLKPPNVGSLARIVAEICEAEFSRAIVPSPENKIIARLPNGTRDLTGIDKLVQYETIKKLTDFINLHGYMQMDTPLIEYLDCLGMYLPEIDANMGQAFSFRDFDNQWLGLRYDLTTSLVRHVIEIGDSISLPIKRQTVGPVFRNEAQLSGKLRQFTQFDVDYVGSVNPIVEAEILRILRDALSVSGLSRSSVCIYLNDRRIIEIFLDRLGIFDPAVRQNILGLLDAQDNLNADELVVRLGSGRKADDGYPVVGLGLEQVQINAIMQFISCPAMPLDDLSLHWIQNQVSGHEQGPQVLESFSWLADSLRDPDKEHICIKLDPKIIRGLSYYSGLIFEARMTAPELRSIGSIAGGGRYDRLFNQYDRSDVSAIGFSIGIDRIGEVLRQCHENDKVDVNVHVEIVASMEQQNSAWSIYELASEIRRHGIRCRLSNGPVGAAHHKAAELMVPVSHRVEASDDGKWKIHNLINGVHSVAETDQVISALLDFNKNSTCIGFRD
jgi:amino acid adenylation domain-containing protein